MIADLDLGVPCSVRRSARAKRLQAVVRGGKVEVVVPRWAGSGHVRAFVAQAAPWIIDKATRLQRDAGTVLPTRCVTGAAVLFEGEPRPLTITRAPQRRARVELSGEFVVTVPERAAEPRIEEIAREALEAWLRGHARRVAGDHVETYAGRIGRRPRGLRIKGQKTVWGSCGPTGWINLNWRLVGAPPRVFEYIVVHELCHLLERNHGAGFWRLVGELMPGYEVERAWLKAQGMRLG